MPVTVRRAAEEDFEALEDLRRDFLEHHRQFHLESTNITDNPEEVFRSEIRENIEDKNKLALVAEEDGEVVGFLFASIESNLEIFKREYVGEIDKLLVRDDSRGRGIGEGMEEEAEKWFRRRDVDLVKTRIINGNSSAEKFWESKGFEDLISVKYKEL
jgi:GNAT superfamily N-acetyltransferase